jgi:hypothetical protein
MELRPDCAYYSCSSKATCCLLGTSLCKKHAISSTKNVKCGYLRCGGPLCENKGVKEYSNVLYCQEHIWDARNWIEPDEDGTPICESECAICYTGFKKPKQQKTLPCGHIYHLDCFRKWSAIRDTCPYCRRYVESYTEFDKIVLSLMQTGQRLIMKGSYYNSSYNDILTLIKSLNRVMSEDIPITVRIRERITLECNSIILKFIVPLHIYIKVREFVKNEVPSLESLQQRNTNKRQRE